MFWKGKVPVLSMLEAYLNGRDIALAPMLRTPDAPTAELVAKCKIGIASVGDSEKISDLLNQWFEHGGKTTVRTTGAWLRSTFLKNAAIWIIARDSGGTIRGCVSSFRSVSPYPNSIQKGCGQPDPWGIVDWFCVHPLWRNKGIASAMLETLDFITQRIGRKAHIFLKEGVPLPQVPVYATVLKCRRAGNPTVTNMREGTGLAVHDYHTVETETGLPLIRVEGLRSMTSELKEWENALDKELPPCFVFVSGATVVDPSRGWKTDSLVSMYAFRWIPGKWLGSAPDPEVL